MFAPGSGEDAINELKSGNAVLSAAECDLINVWVYPGIL
jgi:hypothetical protein